MARVALSEGMSANRTSTMDPSGKGYANIYEETRCIAADCMLWTTDGSYNRSDETMGWCGLSSTRGS